MKEQIIAKIAGAGLLFNGVYVGYSAINNFAAYHPIQNLAYLGMTISAMISLFIGGFFIFAYKED